MAKPKPKNKPDDRTSENKQYGAPPKEGCGRKGPFKKSEVIRFDLDDAELMELKAAAERWRQTDAYKELLERAEIEKAMKEATNGVPEDH